MKEQFQKLFKEKAITKDRLTKINNAISALRELCNHKHTDGSDAMNYKDDGSHRDYHECEICGYEVRDYTTIPVQKRKSLDDRPVAPSNDAGDTNTC